MKKKEKKLKPSRAAGASWPPAAPAPAEPGRASRRSRPDPATSGLGRAAAAPGTRRARRAPARAGHGRRRLAGPACRAWPRLPPEPARSGRAEARPSRAGATPSSLGTHPRRPWAEVSRRPRLRRCPAAAHWPAPARRLAGPTGGGGGARES